MCSIDIIQSMVDINSCISKLSLSRFDLFSRNNIKRLKKVDFSFGDGKLEPEIQFDEPDESIYSNAKNSFLKIISLIHKDTGDKNRAVIYNLLDILENVICGFPEFKKQLIDKNTQEEVDEVIRIAKEQNDTNLPIKIIACKNLIYKEV